jgi:hypothetical protein
MIPALTKYAACNLISPHQSQDMLKRSVPYGDLFFGGGLASASVALLQNSQGELPRIWRTFREKCSHANCRFAFSVRSFVLQGIGRNILLFWSHGKRQPKALIIHPSNAVITDACRRVWHPLAWQGVFHPVLPVRSRVRGLDAPVP